MILPLLIKIVAYLTAVIAVAVGALYYFFQKQFQHWKKRNIPHAKPTFPLGNLNGMNKKNLGVIIREVYDESKHEKLYGFWQLHRPILSVNDPELIKQVLIGDFMSFHDHGVYFNEKKDPLAANLFSIEGLAWRNLRAKLSPTFTSGKMKMMFPILVECGDQLKDVLRPMAEKGEVIEAKEIVARFTTDIIASCAFGVDANSMKNPEAEFRTMGRKIFEPTYSVLLRNTVSFLIPDLGRLLKLTTTPSDVSEFFLRSFREMMDYRVKNNVKRNDVLQLLIQLQEKGYIEDVDADEKEKSAKQDKSPFTFEQAAAQAFIFFVGGFETSSTTMQFILYELALNQDVQTKLRKEIKETLDNNKGQMTYEAVFGMQYLGRVIDETLRKYPPAPLLTRMCTKDYKFKGYDFILRKGDAVSIPTYGMHMDERYFPNPEKFDPDRFTEENKKTRPNFTYLPFGEGPRICIGQRFAFMQTRVGIINIIANYKIDVSPKHTPIPMDFDPKSFIFSPKGGMNLKISSLDK